MVTDAGFAARCPSHQHLNLHGCGKVTDGGAALFRNADVER